MNQSIIHLKKISEKENKTIIGLMSGTSLDGLDLALCNISGTGKATMVRILEFTTIPYDEAQRSRLRSVSSVERVDLKEICYIHSWLGAVHAGMIKSALAEWNVSPDNVDCIASHGQTIYHLPARDYTETGNPLNSTLQVGDGDQVAARTGILTISDFRQKHTAHGGEGAPLAALVDRILFGSDTESRILLNIGGIANYTWLPAGKSDHRETFTTDTGPGNTLIDNVVQHLFDHPFDEDGRIAASGTVQNELLNRMLSDPWFDEPSSKSTGPEYFNLKWVARLLKSMGEEYESVKPEDLVATITELSAAAVAKNISDHLPHTEGCKIYASGGGAHNADLIRRLQDRLPDAEMHNFSELGVDPDAKEAVIFAVLANEMLAGDGFPMESESGVKKVNFGKISFPG